MDTENKAAPCVEYSNTARGYAPGQEEVPDSAERGFFLLMMQEQVPTGSSVTHHQVLSHKPRTNCGGNMCLMVVLENEEKLQTLATY